MVICLISSVLVSGGSNPCSFSEDADEFEGLYQRLRVSFRDHDAPVESHWKEQALRSHCRPHPLSEEAQGSTPPKLRLWKGPEQGLDVTPPQPFIQWPEYFPCL